jgi:hypothetical protein
VNCQESQVGEDPILSKLTSVPTLDTMDNRGRYRLPPELADEIKRLLASAREKVDKAIAAGTIQPGDLERIVKTANSRVPADERELDRIIALHDRAEMATSEMERSHATLHAVYGERAHKFSEPCTSAEPTVLKHDEVTCAAIIAAKKKAIESEPIRVLVKNRGEATAFLHLTLGLSHREIAALRDPSMVESENAELEDLKKAEHASAQALSELQARSSFGSLCAKCHFKARKK